MSQRIPEGKTGFMQMSNVIMNKRSFNDDDLLEMKMCYRCGKIMNTTPGILKLKEATIRIQVNEKYSVNLRSNKEYLDAHCPNCGAWFNIILYEPYENDGKYVTAYSVFCLTTMVEKYLQELVSIVLKDDALRNKFVEMVRDNGTNDKTELGQWLIKTVPEKSKIVLDSLNKKAIQVIYDDSLNTEFSTGWISEDDIS